MRRDILVSYDVNTEEAAGRRRLARVARICKAFGQRVQYSVFECSVNDLDMERLRSRLKSAINAEQDSLRIYQLRGRREEYIESYGIDRYINFDEPLVV